MHPTSTLLRAALALAALCTPLTAGDFFVDPVFGSDANPGTSAALAWKTVTHGAAQLDGSADILNLLPGVYSAASGESFPISFTSLRLRGQGAPGDTVLRGNGSGTLLRSDLLVGSSGFTTLDRLRLEQADTGFEATATTGLHTLVVNHVEFLDLDATGMLTRALGGAGTPAVQAFVTDSRFERCGTGLSGFSNAPSPFLNMAFAMRCSFIDCDLEGVRIHNLGATAFTAQIQASTLAGNPIGLRSITESGGGTELRLFSSLIHGGQTGVDASSGAGGTTNTRLSFSTVAGNSLAGVRVTTPGGQAHTDLEDSLLWGNGDDLDLAGSLDASFNDIEDGDLLGVAGNFSSDPLFANAPAGDYRLTWGSPCIEGANPGIGLGPMDLFGNLRPSDGNLDTLLRLDVGAIEYQPLEIFTTGAMGTPLRMEIHGDAGAPTTLLWTRVGLTLGTPTPFGTFYLDPILAGPMFSTSVGANNTFTFQRTIPIQPGLVGKTFSFQALTRSTLAPQGLAYSNGVQFTVVP